MFVRLRFSTVATAPTQPEEPEAEYCLQTTVMFDGN
jgi:hypothetical protein